MNRSMCSWLALPVLLLLALPVSVSAQEEKKKEATEESKEPSSGAPEAAEIEFHFDNQPLDIVLKRVKDYLTPGAKISVADSRLFNRPLSLHSPKKLTRTEALELTKAALLLNGMRLVQKDKNSWEIVQFLTTVQVQELHLGMGLTRSKFKGNPAELKAKAERARAEQRRVVLPPPTR